MTEKRYGLTYDNQIFDNLISDPITNERAVELLNNSLKRINALRKENKELQRHVDVMRSGALTDDKRIKELYDENEQLKFENIELTVDNKELKCTNNKLYQENGQLKQRNTNQYNQLNELWEIIEEENWEKLIAMKKQLKEDEERLQKEWKCYE